MPLSRAQMQIAVTRSHPACPHSSIAMLCRAFAWALVTMSAVGTGLGT